MALENPQRSKVLPADEVNMGLKDKIGIRRGQAPSPPPRYRASRAFHSKKVCAAITAGMSGFVYEISVKVDFRFLPIEIETSATRTASLLGRTERSSPEAVQRGAAGAGLVGDGGDQAIIGVAMMSVLIIAWCQESVGRTGWQTGPWQSSIRCPAASACRHLHGWKYISLSAALSFGKLSRVLMILRMDRC